MWPKLTDQRALYNKHDYYHLVFVSSLLSHSSVGQFQFWHQFQMSLFLCSQQMEIHSPPLYRVLEEVSAASNFKLWKLWQWKSWSGVECDCDLGELSENVYKHVNMFK